jgi:hypothetical protein
VDGTGSGSCPEISYSISGAEFSEFCYQIDSTHNETTFLVSCGSLIHKDHISRNSYTLLSVYKQSFTVG